MIFFKSHFLKAVNPLEADQFFFWLNFLLKFGEVVILVEKIIWAKGFFSWKKIYILFMQKTKRRIFHARLKPLVIYVTVKNLSFLQKLKKNFKKLVLLVKKTWNTVQEINKGTMTQDFWFVLNHNFGKYLEKIRFFDKNYYLEDQNNDLALTSSSSS